MTNADPGRSEPEALLARYRTATRREVGRRLPSGWPQEWLYDPVADYPQRPSKGIRAALCLAASDAMGGAPDSAVVAAAAIEMLHSACLIHDDIQDDGLTRRGAPALHRREGLALALNAGDALAAVSLEVMGHAVAGLGRDVRRRVMADFSCAIRRALEGQAIELGWRRDRVVDVTLADYLDLVLRKTCWYTAIAPLRIGATIGSDGRARLDVLTRLGFFLGVAFQVTDDILNLAAQRDRYDKDLTGDLTERKRSLIVVHLLGAARPSDLELLVQILTSPEEPGPDEVKWLVAAAEAYGSLHAAQAVATAAAQAAHNVFDLAFREAAPSEPAQVVRHLIDYSVARDH
jgi:geranylgeranyl diphosphate synthase type II